MTCNTVDFENLQSLIVGCCGTEAQSNNPICKAVAAGDVVTSVPFSCMVDLIENFSGCNKNLPQHKLTAAYNAYTDVVKYQPIDWNQVFTVQNNQHKAMLNYNSFYMFTPIIILLLIMIWVLVAFKRMHWALGLFFTVLVFVVLYSFSVAYRLNANIYFNNRNSDLQSIATSSKNSYQNSIAYIPQALFAAACAVTSDSNSGSWSCNQGHSNSQCPPCAATNQLNPLPNPLNPSNPIPNPLNPAPPSTVNPSTIQQQNKRS